MTARKYLFKLRFESDWCPWEKCCAEVNLSWSYGPPDTRVELKERRVKVNLARVRHRSLDNKLHSTLHSPFVRLRHLSQDSTLHGTLDSKVRHRRPPFER